MEMGSGKTNKFVRVKVPGTCGEWIQSIENKRECLISLPIDRFTIMEISMKDCQMGKISQNQLMEKSMLAFNKICNYLDLHESLRHQIHFEMISHLEIGKGMASSTADIVAVMAGVSTLMGRNLSPECLLKLACEIEPSDGIMFPELTLIDHLEGQKLESYTFKKNMKILMLKPENTFETESMRTKLDYLKRLSNKSGKPLHLFREAVSEKSLEKMGQASTCSLLENENILEKPYLKELLELAYIHSCYGVVGGHSGTVCGLLLHEIHTDLSRLMEDISKAPLGAYYTGHEIVHAYYHGIEISKG